MNINNCIIEQCETAFKVLKESEGLVYELILFLNNRNNEMSRSKLSATM